MSPGSTSSGCTLAQGFRIAGVGRAGVLRRLELGPHVAGEVRVGGQPFLGVGVLVDQVAQFVDDLTRRAAVEGGDVGQVDTAAVVQGHQQPFLGVADRGDGRAAAHHVLAA